jgi:hypothetical protein
MQHLNSEAFFYFSAIIIALGDADYGSGWSIGNV